MASILPADETSFLIPDNINSIGYSVVWVDALVNSLQNLDAQKKLRSSINCLQTFENIDQCEKYIQSIPLGHRIVLIISGDFSQESIQKFNEIYQIFSIYIYCANKQYHEQWSEQYRKIKGVFNQIDDLINQIQMDHSIRRQHNPEEAILMSVYNSNNTDEQSTTGLDGTFVQTQLLISCLLKMKTTSEDKKEFITYCRQRYKNNPTALKHLDEFEVEYEPEYSLWWYARETFFYRLLNEALRKQDINLLFLFRFFIRDLYEELSHRHYSSLIRVYRGQLLSKDEFEILKNGKDSFISMNSFISTSTNVQVALTYLGSINTDDKYERILFEIDADPYQNGIKPFADLSKISMFPEDEILMMLGSVFRLKNVYLGENQIWHVQMNLCCENDEDLRMIFDHMKDQYGRNNSQLLLFGYVLIDMANFDDAEQYLHRLLKQLPSDHQDIYKCYHALGKVLFEKGKYSLSLNSLRKSIEVLEKNQLSDVRIAYVYNNLGEVYQKIGNIKQALESFQKALNIFQLKPEDHQQNLAWCYNNLGIIYQDEKNYSKALDYQNEALNIKTKLLPAKHPCLGNTYNNIGNVYYYLQQYDQALKSYKLSYDIFSNSLTPRHPSLARIVRNIGIIHEIQKEFVEAMNKYERAATIREKILSPSHPDLYEIKEDITRVTLKMKKTIL